MGKIPKGWEMEKGSIIKSLSLLVMFMRLTNSPKWVNYVFSGKANIVKKSNISFID